MKEHASFKRIVCFYAFSLIVVACCCISALAQKTASVAISPASVDAKIKSGGSYTQTFTITNGTSVRLRFRCSFNDFWFDAQNKRLNGRAGTLPRSASNWIQFTPSEIVVEPHASATVKAVITVPQAVAGSFYTAPVFEGMPVEQPAALTKVKSQENSATTSIGVRFRGLMMLTTEEGAEYNVEILGGKVAPPSASSEMEIALDLRNRGTAHAKVRGSYAILNSAGKLAGRGELDEKRLLPTQRDLIKSRWAGNLTPGNYACLVTLTYNRVGKEPMSLVYELPFTVE